ncbi:MAG: excisionase family DNA-binding protein [Elusimicrobia bacterium]|nr:excisionase family DNA-binding protein [Elusimicrobiota bacterium]
MVDDILSTGQAARLCSVTRDTVLKWIKLGKLKAVQTPGGHYRVRRASIRPYISTEPASQDPKRDSKTLSFCWEYHSGGRDLERHCRECIVFKSQAQKCFLMAGLGAQAGHAGVHCKDNCYECEYFRFINAEPPNVLLVTEDEGLKRRLESQAGERLVLKAAGSGYEASAMVHDFRPDFIIVDDGLAGGKAFELCKHLTRDPRVAGAQIVLAVPKGREKAVLPQGVCASIDIPFSAGELQESFLALRKSLWGPRPGRPRQENHQ